MGGKHLTITCKLSLNGHSVTLRALIDCGANGYLFLNTLCAYDLAPFLGTKFQRLPRDYYVKGYDEKSQTSVSHFTRAHLTVDGRRQYNAPFLVLNLGSHDMILGRKWLAQFDIGIDCRRRRLIWPKGYGPSHSMIRELETTRENLLLPIQSPSHQEDADARDCALEAEDRALGIQAPRPGPTDLESDRSSDSDPSGSTDLTDYESDGPEDHQPPVQSPNRQIPLIVGSNQKEIPKVPKPPKGYQQQATP